MYISNNRGKRELDSGNSISTIAHVKRTIFGLFICSELSGTSDFPVDFGLGGNPGARKENPVLEPSLQKAEE